MQGLHPQRLFLVLFLLSFVCAPASAQEADGGKLKFSGDFRFRAELDRDSQSSDGSQRDDRDRLRFRARFGVNYQIDQRFSLGLRLRTGSSEATQSPHVTIGDELTPKSFSVDKAFAKVGFDGGSLWVGKNSFPFWKQNEHFWDDDATPEGVAGSYTFSIGDGSSLTGTAAYFVLDTPTSNSFGDQAKLVAGQLALKSDLGGAAVEAAAGYFGFRENPDQPDPRLQDLNYSIVVVGAKAKFKVGSRTLEVGADLMANFEDYESSLFNNDQTTGYMGSVKYGGLSNKGDFLFAYYYAHIEKYAVVARYAQDDWVRWGSSTATRSSNFSGHELRAAVALGSKNNIVARLYLVEGLELESASAAAVEVGVRIRIDWNIGF